MAQTSYSAIGANQSGLQYRTQDNDRYAAALTEHSGTSRPSYAVAGTFWLDTSATPWTWYVYDGTDDIAIGTVNATTNLFAVANGMSSSSTIAMTAAINEAAATVASASTTDIGAAAGNYVSITGTTTITALGTVQAGTRRTCRFAGALTLTHNATSLILPGGANITTAAGDVATFVSLGSGNWFCSDFLKVSRSPLQPTLDSLEALNLVSGDILYATAADTLQRLAKGADGQVLTLASGVPSWAAAAAGGGGLVLLERKSVSSQSAITFTTGITSAYDSLLLSITRSHPATDNTNLLLAVSYNAGSSWETTEYRQIYGECYTAYGGAVYDNTQIGHILDLGARASSGVFTGTVYIGDLAGGSSERGISSQCAKRDANNNMKTVLTSGWNGSVGSQITGIKLFYSSGNVAAFTGALYGFTNA